MTSPHTPRHGDRRTRPDGVVETYVVDDHGLYSPQWVRASVLGGSAIAGATLIILLVLAAASMVGGAQ